MTYCGCDYDSPSVYNKKTVKGRSEYQCCECNGKILKGEKHQYLFGIWGGHADTFRTCARCVDIWDFVEGNVPCACLAHGGLNYASVDAIADAYDRARDEVTGLWFGYQRRVILRRRHNERAVAQ